MRSQLIAPTLALVRDARGAAAATALARRHDLPAGAADAPEVALPLAGLRALLDDAAATAGEPMLGVRLAERFPRGGYGVVEFSCRSAPTIRAALARLVRYVALLNELVAVSLEDVRGAADAAAPGRSTTRGRAGHAVVEQRIAGEPLCVGRHGNEFFVAHLVARARELSGVPVVPERAWFAHPAPADGEVAALCQAIGTTRVRFGAGANGLALAAALLDAPLASSDPPLLSILDDTAEKALAGRGGGARLIGLVRERIRAGLGEAPPSLAAVAATLRMSTRTLQRRLADDGVSFADLVDEVRRDLALDYVRDPRRPLGEVAFLLGYAELSPFLRAFKRWTGRTPAEVRAEA
jgi:AraC-like DNA-binding protein